MTDVYIHVGSSLCIDPMPHDTALMCTPPPSPSGIDKEGNAPVVVSNYLLTPTLLLCMHGEKNRYKIKSCI